MEQARQEYRNGPLTPEEFQRQLQEFMRQHLGGGGNSASGASKAETTDAKEGSGPEDQSEEEWDFDYKPRDIKKYLDRFVIRQEEAKRVLSVALCDHYHHVRQAREGGEQAHYNKQNILLMGPTGVGKTYLIRQIADLIGVPFVKADATKFSETGYVGSDAEDLVRDLIRQADGDVSKAQYGIIYLDEVDKIATPSQAGSRDVSGRGVQMNLLKLMEETEVSTRAPNDISGQLQAMMDFTQRAGKKGPETISTRHILFVVSGAFEGLEEIARKRLQESQIGFVAPSQGSRSRDEVLQDASTDDFIKFGFEPEFIGRLPVRVVCHELGVDDLLAILQTSEGSILQQYQDSFAAYGIRPLFDEGGLRRIAELAAEDRTGARGLMTICERVFRDFKFELPSTDIKEFVVSRGLVDQPRAELRNLLDNREVQERRIQHQWVHEFAKQFRTSHGLYIEFTEAAADKLVKLAEDRKQSILDLCNEKFKDFQFGLKLLFQNTGQDRCVIEEHVVDDPDKVLSDWVVASYHHNPQEGHEGSGRDDSDGREA